MAKTDPQVAAHLEWLGFIQPTGLVVSATALARAGAVLDRRDAEGQRLLRACAGERRFGTDSEPHPYVSDFRTFAREVLGWNFSPKGYAGADVRPIPAELQLPLPDVGEKLQPDYAVAERDPGDGDGPWQLLVAVLDPGCDLDRAGARAGRLDLTPHDRMQRMLRSAGVPAGLLFNGRTVRLVSAPRGESAGWMDFPVTAMLATAGRPLCAALRLLLSEQRLLALPRAQRLAALLADSRAWQNEVSERLAEQVLHALYELLRGFQAAHDASDGTLLREPLADEPDEVYRALLTVVLRLVFLLYAEERNLLPADGAFRAHYSLAGLYERLREDAALYPDTMDQRFEAWPQLLALFRMVHDGVVSGDMRLPARRGVLFDPDRFPFLEGRAGCGVRQIHERVEAPRVSDGTVHRVLEKLLVLDGERISYRALDVEQIGSVYETMMGFRLETAVGRSAAIRSAKRHGAPATVNLDALLDQPSGARAKWLRERTDRKLTDRVGRAVRAAVTLHELHAALDAVIDPRATPDLVPTGAMVLQPNAERRRSGSHYTPRTLTEPIVRTALEPILARLRRDGAAPPRPEAILDLKVCDPAMGSGAFLVETCRQLAEALIEAWRAHGGTPSIEPDDDEVIVARRLVAQKCLYGVDRNPVAVDLAKMSLWLATLARDEPLTFIDHALRHGDSLVGLSRRQIEAFHWEGDAPDFQTGFEVMRVREHLEQISVLRRRIREADPSVPDRDVRHWWWQASRKIDAVGLFGDLVVTAFFEGRKPTEREQCRVAAAALVTAGEAESRRERVDDRRRAYPPLAPFHWALEFPEVFERKASGEEDEGAPGAGNGPGFDAVVGNPPFAGKNTVAGANPAGYPDWLKILHEQSHGNADLVAHFFRRAFTLVREGGTFGLIATNTIAQGDTRSTGLRWICTHGGDVYHARRRLKWPGLAAVVVSVVHVCKGWFEKRAASTAPSQARGRLGSDGGPAMPGRRLVDAEAGARADQQRRPPCHAGSRRLDGIETDRITAFLFHRGGHEDPARLHANAGKSFQGSIVLGMGFTFDDSDTKGVASPLADMRRLMADPRNRDVILPYIGGEEVNTSPTHAHHRYVINFRDYPLRREELCAPWSGAEGHQRREWLRRGIVPLDYPDPVAADWPELLAIVEERVKPERQTLGDNGDARRRKEKWWLWGRYTPGLFGAIAGLNRVLAISRVGQQAALTFLPAGMVYAESTIAFPFSDYAAFCILQSRPHETWARFFASSMKDDLRYTPSDCFETFPFPEAWETRADLEAMGRTCHEFRADLMVRRNEGLTRTYNRFHDPNESTPEVVTLRSLHAAMDRAVLDAYGWRDVPTDCEFLLDYAVDEDEPGSRKKPYRYRWPDAVRDEVLVRLLELNGERAAEETRAGGAGVPAVAGPKPERSPSRSFSPRSGASRAGESRPLWGHPMNDVIIDAPAEVAAYLDQVRHVADANRDALGFLPASAYDEAAMKGCLWVAVEGTTKKLRGYLFFGDTFPRLRVYQVYVQPEFRSLGTARTLMERLKAYGEGHDYLTITARVAAELPANKFWRRLGFSVVGRYPGGKRDRTINRYALELDVPTLFGQSRPVPDSMRQPLHVRPVLETRTYVIDLNVFFDAIRDRDEGEAVDILSMALDNDMRLVVTEEFTRELERHSHQATDATDPVLKLARALPTLPKPRPDALGSLMDDLRRQLFSTGPVKTGRRAANDASDLVHLASCICHRVYGFITRDGAILRRAEELRERYNLRIISPADLCEPLEGSGVRLERMTAMVGREEVEIAAFDERDRMDVERFLGECRVSSTDMAGCLAAGTTRFPTTISVMKVGRRIVGFGSWADIPAAGHGSVARLYVDEEFSNVDRIVDHLLEHSINRGTRGRLCRVDLKTGPGQVTIRDIAIKRGFRRPDSGSGAGPGDLSKMSMMGPITGSNWRVFRTSFREATGRELPRDLPRYEELVNTGVVLEAERAGRPLAVSLFDFETAISPGALISRGRIGVMVPVREPYARQLLPLRESQGSLLAKRETVLRLERAYFLAAGKHRLLPRGTIVVFYASQERREAVAMARVTFSDTLTKGQAVLKLGRQGVLTAEEIEQRANAEGEVASFTFDNLMVFRKGIPYRELKRLGCIGGANLVTAQELPYEKLRLVVDRAVDVESS